MDALPKPTVTQFYKYGSVNTSDRMSWLKEVLIDHSLYCPTMRELNDPREGRPRFADVPNSAIVDFIYGDYLQREPNSTTVEHAKVLSELNEFASHFGKEVLLQKMADVLHQRLAETRVYSMSQRWDSLSMWAKYSDGHAGYCLEFKNVGVLSAAVPVVYDDSAKLDLRSIDASDAGLLRTKRTDWSNEEEVRIVVPRTMGMTRLKISPDMLTRVILGEHMSPDHRKQIQEWARNRTPPLEVVSAKFNPHTQELELIPA